MAKSELHFLGHIIDLITVETDYNKLFNKYKGTPVLYNGGGLLKFVFDFEENFRFLERMTTINYDLYKKGYPVDDGKITFYDANDDNLKTWKFKDAPIVDYKVKFDTNGGGMRVEMILSPAIQDYGCKIHRSWHITPIEEETYQSPIYMTEQEETIPRLIEYHYENKKGTRIEEKDIRINQEIELVITTKDAEKTTMKIDLNNSRLDFIHNGKIIENDILKGVKINSEETRVSLTAIKQ